MYFKKIEKWTNLDWDLFFKFNKIKNNQKEIKDKLRGSKDLIIFYFQDFKNYGLINGIGPGYISSIFRKIISFLFRGVRYEFHDLGYSIGGTWKDKLKYDYGLLKYSVLDLVGSLLLIKKLNLPTFAKIPIYIGGIITSIIEGIIILFCFIMVVIFGSFAFRFTK